MLFMRQLKTTRNKRPRALFHKSRFPLVILQDFLIRDAQGPQDR